MYIITSGRESQRFKSRRILWSLIAVFYTTNRTNHIAQVCIPPRPYQYQWKYLKMFNLYELPCIVVAKVILYSPVYIQLDELNDEYIVTVYYTQNIHFSHLIILPLSQILIIVPNCFFFRLLLEILRTLSTNAYI